MTAKPFESTSAATADAFASIMRGPACGHLCGRLRGDAVLGGGPAQAA